MNLDILELIVSKMDNKSIQSLSLVPGMWEQIRVFSNHQRFWYLRTQVLMKSELGWTEGDWKGAYYILSRSRELTNLEDNALATRILLSLEVDLQLINLAIKQASREGYIEIVKLLLQDGRADPTVSDNYSIIRASESGHTEVVRLLLQDGRADPGASAGPNFYTDSAIIRACENNHPDVVYLLAQDERVDPSSGNNFPIQWASKYGHTEVVRLLLQDKRVDPSARNNLALVDAYIGGFTGQHDEVISLLLEDKRVDPSAYEEYKTNPDRRWF